MLARLRVKSLEEFGDLVRHSGEEYTYVLEGRVVLHTEFYDPLTLEVGESVYIDSNMGHAYVVGDGCREAAVLCLCSSSEESLIESLLTLHGPNDSRLPAAVSKPRRKQKLSAGGRAAKVKR